MKTKIVIKSVFGSILFEYEKENNTIKETLLEAIKSGAYLGGADLRGAYLGGADLGGANLRGADLGGAYLGGADLGDANLRGADLGGADLRDAKIKDKGILLIGNIGSRCDCTTIYNTDKGIYVKCGCFFGTIDEFVAKVKETHKGNEHERDYLAMVEFAKIKFSEK